MEGTQAESSTCLCDEQVVVAALNKVSDESRAAFFEKHSQLRAQSSAVGEALPEITREGVLAIVQEAVQSAEAELVSSPKNGLQIEVSCASNLQTLCDDLDSCRNRESRDSM